MAERVFTQVFGVVAGLLEKDGKFLLVREAEGTDKGKWNQPAGWIDVGEDPLDAVKREVKEETGHDFTPIHLLGIYSLVRKDLQSKLHATPHPIKLVYIGDISASTTALHDDVSEARWFTAEEILTMSSEELRDLDIKQLIKDYQSGRRFPLEIMRHTVVD